MSYKTIGICVNDQAYISRIMSAIAQEQQSKGGPVAPNLYLEEIRWAVASASDVEAAYSYALDANIPNPGGDESVITDGMILSSVQANWPASA